MGKKFNEILNQMRREAILSHDKRKVLIIDGPPGSGKTTYVQQRKQPGDIVVDLDMIATAIQGSWDPHPDYSTVMDAVLAAREAIYSTIENREGKWNAAYIITSNPSREAVGRIADRLRGSVITMETTQDQCIERITKDISRSDKQRDIDLAKKWYAHRQD